MRIGILQLNATIGAFDQNKRRLLRAYKEAVDLDAELVAAPELFLCGYPPRDLLLREDFVGRCLQTLECLALEIGSVPLLVGYVERNENRPGRPLYNAAALLHDGKIVHRIYKSLLPTYDVFDEDRYFEPASAVAPIRVGERLVGVTICEDIWNDADFWPTVVRRYRADPVEELVAQGAEVLLNLSASPWHRGKEVTRLALLRQVTRDDRIPVVQVNMVGGNDELIFDGHSLALNGQGQVLAVGAGFREEVMVVDLAAQPGPSAELHSREERDELLFEALVLGIRDYVEKCGFKSVVLGLSGGIDSALVATLAAQAVGPDLVWGVSLPSRYSSEGSLSDAAALAKNLGIRYQVLPIDTGVSAVEKILSETFVGQVSDQTEENIQSRLRGLILMALSNKFGSLVLTTGNKSEMAVGYCTLYGDMCGALAVIADVFKTEVYSLARWVNRKGEIIPQTTLIKAPSAELRPNQTDQDSLPPYEILDSILSAYVVDEADPRQLTAGGHNPVLVREVLKKISTSEYKRRQAAPGLKISARAFGAGRRIPIAAAGDFS